MLYLKIPHSEILVMTADFHHKHMKTQFQDNFILKTLGLRKPEATLTRKNIRCCKPFLVSLYKQPSRINSCSRK